MIIPLLEELTWKRLFLLIEVILESIENQLIHLVENAVNPFKINLKRLIHLIEDLQENVIIVSKTKINKNYLNQLEAMKKNHQRRK